MTAAPEADIHVNQIQLSTSIPGTISETHLLSVLAKRVYDIDPSGNCRMAASGHDFEFDTKFYHETGELMMADFELYPLKPLTDVVIKGDVKGSSKQKIIQAQVQVAGYSKLSILVFGSRKAYKDPSGIIRFTDPEPIDVIPLRYDFAYGGADKVAEENLPPMNKDVQKAFPGVDFDYSSQYRYPRNPCGKGYLVENTERALEDFDLPNLEDPNMLLTPKNLLVGHPENWINQPLPRATDWVNMAWFPRIAYFGILPLYNKKALQGQLPEHYFHWAEPDILVEKEMEKKFNIRCANGASCGLQYPHLNGSESIRFTNISGKSDFVLQLPNDKPRIWIDGRKGKLVETSAVLHTVLVDLNENKLTLVWRGSGPALRPYHLEELKTMPFKVEWR